MHKQIRLAVLAATLAAAGAAHAAPAAHPRPAPSPQVNVCVLDTGATTYALANGTGIGQCPFDLGTTVRMSRRQYKTVLEIDLMRTRHSSALNQQVNVCELNTGVTSYALARGTGVGRCDPDMGTTVRMSRREYEIDVMRMSLPLAAQVSH